jgi:mono/diheme cytochrome c family protein
MSRRNWIHAILVAVLVIVVLLAIRLHGASGQSAAGDALGDAANGRFLVEAWCTECHSVELKTAGKGQAAPDFTAIAKRPGTTSVSLHAFFRSNHKSMPNLVLTRNDADDIAAYILSLRRR